ncbi:MAG: PEP-CTERM sorting domain-containing protein [Akkermansiaceae bacterium]|jgi:hypothetical protein|nr:PEP-CTERM sorting domain-containing protein [Akkermansiaceae bacterium]
MKIKLLLMTLAICQSAAQAAITVTNNGTVTPTGFVTGNTSLDPHATLTGLPEVFGFRNANTHGQSFTVAAPLTLGSIFIGYGTLTGAATAMTISLTVDAGNNGSNEITETFSLTTSSITQESSPYSGIHWLELDVSSSALTLAAGTHSFRLTATSVTGATNTWLLAPSYTGSTGFVGNYTGGNMTGTGISASFPTRDANFAITAVPEPGSLLLLGLGALPILRRRHRA